MTRSQVPCHQIATLIGSPDELHLGPNAGLRHKTQNDLTHIIVTNWGIIEENTFTKSQNKTSK